MGRAHPTAPCGLLLLCGLRAIAQERGLPVRSQRVAAADSLVIKKTPANELVVT